MHHPQFDKRSVFRNYHSCSGAIFVLIFVDSRCENYIFTVAKNKTDAVCGDEFSNKYINWVAMMSEVIMVSGGGSYATLPP